MKFLVKFLQIVAMVGLLLLVFCWTIVGILRSNQQLTGVLDNSGFYEVASVAVVKQINGQLTGDEQSVETTKQIVQQKISKQLVRAALQPLQITIIEWLIEDHNNLKIELDLQEIKSKLTDQLEAEQKFTINKTLPDRLILPREDQFGQQDLSTLHSIKSIYQFSEFAIPVLGLSIFGSSVLLLIMNLRRGSRKYTSFLYPIFLASAVGLLLVGVSYLFKDMVVVNSELSQVALGASLISRIMIAVIQQTLWLWVMVGILSISSIMITRVLLRKQDKKQKEKHRK